MSIDIRDSLNSPSRIRYLDRNCTVLHITKSFSKKGFYRILKRCNKLKKITYSKSTKNRISKESKKLLKENNIKLYIKKEQGRPIDLTPEKINNIIKMHKDYSYRELEEKLNVPKSTIHYFIRRAKKKKLKDGKKIVYLK